MVESGVYLTPGKMTFNDFTKDWEKNFVLAELEEKTIISYLFHTKKRIAPFFGLMYMEQIKTLHILNFMDMLRQPNARLDGADPLKSASLVYNYRVLKSIFTKAMEWKVITNNPMTGIKKPKEDDIKEMEVYDEKEIKQLFEALEHESLQLRTAITLAVTAGMRRGEITGLEWAKINLELGYLFITQSITKFKEGAPIS